MSILIGITCIVGILFMSILSFTSIWIVVLSTKSFRQMKYGNYISEKIYDKINIKSHINTLEIDSNLNLDKEDINSSIDNIKNFDMKNKAH